MKTIVFAPLAAKQFDTLPTDAQAAVEWALARYAITGLGDVRRLKGTEGCRLRVGSYRVLFDETETSIWVAFVGRRSTTTYH
jgi:mRNA interferase RelE/StbE